MVPIDSLTTGQVAGIIAAGIFIIRMIFKLVWPLIMVGLMDMTEPATAWSKVGAQIQGSLWPTLLGSDSTKTNGIKSSIRLAGKMGLLSTLLLSLASIITPLGLYESITPNTNQDSVQFAYAKDGSVFGSGTLPRPAEGFSRICGNFGPAACPQSGTVLESTRNSTTISISDQDKINPAVPADYMSYLQSGAKAIGPMVSSIFDIGYRTYSYSTDVNLGTVNGGKKYVVGQFSQFDTLFLQEDYHIIEGLIVDSKNGSIGFRNHTLPAASPFGAEWTEDILFIEPQTECANTNLTFEWTIPLNTSSLTDVQDLVLVDNGGFINMNRTFPPLDMTTMQDDPQLSYRAYRSAWLQNAYTALYFNVTNPGPSISGMKAFSYMNSEMGNQIPMQKTSYSGASTWLNKRFSMGAFGAFIDGVPTSSDDNSTSNYTVNVAPNPWNISTGNFSDAREACGGILPSTRANTTNILGFCGAALGIPQQKGTPSIVRFEPGTSYSQPLFGCASVMRAVVKTVSFRFNGTGLGALTVTNVEDKQYENEAAWPLWGVESADIRVDEASPLWGIIDETKKDQYTEMTFAKKSSFYLPGYADGADLGTSPAATYENLPGADFYRNALSFAYSVGFLSSNDGTFDYSGANSVGVYNKWKNMTATGEGVARAINQIWADAAANAVVGTKSWVADSSTLAKRQSDGSAASQALVPVYRYSRRVLYHLPYAIPAIILLSVFASALCLSLGMAVFGSASPGKMRVFLMKTSIGRVMTSLLSNDVSVASAPSETWSGRLGRMRINFVDAVPRAAAVGEQPTAHESEVYDPMLGKSSSTFGLREIKFTRR